MNDATSGTYAEPNATIGSSDPQHDGVDAHQLDEHDAEHEADRRCPTTARTTRVPVVSALLRSTDIAPSTTQKPCWTGNTWVTATASASPRPVRRLLRTTTDAVAEEAVASATRAPETPSSSRSAAPVVGQPRPEHARPHRAGVGGRRDADDPTGRADARRDGAPGQQLSARSRSAAASSGSPRISTMSSR